MFKIKVARTQFPDYIFFGVIGFLTGAILKDIYPYDKVSAISIIALLVICLLAYLWKFSVTYRE